jgi:hypothetical protein
MSRHEKIHTAQLVVLAVKETGRFLKYDRNRHGWIEVSESVARKRVCQAFQYRRQRGSSDTTRTFEETSSSSEAGRAGEAHHPLPYAQGRVLPNHVISLPSVALANSVSQQGMFPASPPQQQPGDGFNEADSDFQSVLRTLSRAPLYGSEEEGEETRPG